MENITLEYKGYLGTVEFSAEDNCLFGKVIGINDLISYEAQEVSELKEVFEEAVNDYLFTCKELGKQPTKTLKRVFNIRRIPNQDTIEAIKEARSSKELKPIDDLSSWLDVD